MNYFERSVIDTIKAAGNFMQNKNAGKLLEQIIELESKIPSFDFLINKLMNDSNYPIDHPEIKLLFEKKKVLQQFTKGFRLYQRYLAEAYKGEFSDWLNEYNQFYLANPITVFNELIPTGELNASSEEYILYRALKTFLNPIKNGSPDPKIDPNKTLYYVIDTTQNAIRIRNDKKLLGGGLTSMYIFYSQLSDIISYHRQYPFYDFDATFNTQNPVQRRAIKKFVAVCVLPKELLSNYSTTVPVYYMVNDIFQPRIIVKEVIDFLLAPPRKKATMTARAQILSGGRKGRNSR